MMKFLYSLVFVFFLYVNVTAQIRSAEVSTIDIKELLKNLSSEKAIALPGQDGIFTLIPNDLVGQEMIDLDPDLRSYDVYNESGLEVGSAVKTASTFYYTLDKDGGLISFYPDHKNGGYLIDEGAGHDWECTAEDLKHKINGNKRSDIGKYTYGDDLQSFSLAIITTGEFYEQHGNSDNVVRGEIFKTLSGVNRIFERDLSLNFVLQGRLKMFSDKNTDPFTPVDGGGGSERTIQSSRAFDAEFEDNTYDIGITFNANTDADGWPGGGLAVIQSACDPATTINGPTKARIWACSEGESNNYFTVVVCHELGHAFGARHTFNSDSQACKDVISSDNAYEIGSGNTIMSYGGRCGEGDDYVEPTVILNNYFHFSSLYLMSQYVNSLGCQSIFTTSNTPPDLTINPCGMASFQVPLSTPFSITAEGSDPEEDDLTYVWEQFDEDGVGSPNAGFLGSEAASSNKGPLFRGYAPSSSPSRDFPRFFNFFFQDPFETLSQVPRDLTLRCTVRDNNSEGGIFTSDEVTVNVMDVGPLMIELDSLVDTIVGGQSIDLSWNDDGISGLCDRVDVVLISLTDPNIVIPVASNVPYGDLGLVYLVSSGFSIDGDFHFKVECHVSDCFSFYSYSRPFFSRSNNCPAPELYFTCGLEDITANIGDEVLNQSAAEAVTGIRTYTENITINNDDPFTEFARYTLIGECETLTFPSGNPVILPTEFITFRVSENGMYRFANLDSDFAGLLVYDEALYQQGELCAALVGANVTESLNSPASLVTSTREWVDVELNTCTNYLLGIIAFPQTPVFEFEFSISISGEGPLSIQDGSPLDNSFYYVVEDEEGLIEAILPTADFTQLRQGSKRVYTIKVDPETFVPSDFIGKLLVDLGLEGQCVGRSSNTTELLLINPLPDEDMDGYHTDEDCDDTDENVNPGQTEVLNNSIDENCDGLIEGDDEDMDGFVVGLDCDDSNAEINPDAEEILNNDVDEDCDGVANVIDEDMDGFNSDEDCDDANALINSDATEIPNNDVDENCDGIILVIDVDMDGFNSDEDCDDNDALINTDAEEIANNDVDENCDGIVLVIDEDMDGFNSSVDCDDTDPAINPDAEEIPSNEVDEDCDGIVLNFDADMDGFNSEDDCDDSNAEINPDAEEIANNDIDENCDGEILMIDEDMDGFNSSVDCDDTDPAINPGAEEIPNNDVDENCDGAVILIDEDMDGFNSDEDCDDMNAAINPEAVEVPNNDVDEDCDGEANVVDEDMDGFNSDEDCDDTDASINPDAAEVPNNDVDENCNGELGFTDEDMDGFNGSVDCNDLDSLIFPGAIEIPNNGIDEDCDGEDLTSGVNDFALDNIEIYPNPVEEMVIVDFGLKMGRVSLFNVNGVLLKFFPEESSKHLIDLSDIESGVYFIKVHIRAEQTEFYRKIVKL